MQWNSIVKIAIKVVRWYKEGMLVQCGQALTPLIDMMSARGKLFLKYHTKGVSNE